MQAVSSDSDSPHTITRRHWLVSGFWFLVSLLAERREGQASACPAAVMPPSRKKPLRLRVSALKTLNFQLSTFNAHFPAAEHPRSRT
jgi:hypothetical protein